LRPLGLLVVGLIALLPGFAAAQAWPAKPIRWIVPFAPGGSLDTSARIFAVPMGTAFKQQIVIENRAGASGNIGADAAAKATPDGYTMLFSTVSLTINETLYRKLPFDLKKDLIPVVQVAVLPNVMVVPPSLPATTIQEFVALAQQKPGTMNFGSGGTGTSVHVMGELFKLKAGIDITHVPYKGSGPAVSDLVGGRVQIMFDAAPSLIAHVRSGKLRVLAAASTERNRLLPDVPTFAELGYPQVNVSLWYGLLAPAGTPRAVVEKLNRAVGQVLDTKEVTERLQAQGAEPMRGTPEAFATFMQKEMAKWAPVVKAANVKAE